MVTMETYDKSNVILEALMGSKAYGLDTPESDEDFQGVFLFPNHLFLGLNCPGEKHMTNDHTGPEYSRDYCHHELLKFCRLTRDANPTLVEVLWADHFSVLTEAGKLLVDNREMFLSTQKVKDRFGGYATSQALKFGKRSKDGKSGASSRTKNRPEKHARHCFRLLRQGTELLQTGSLTLRCSQEEREDLFAIGDLAVSEPEKLFQHFEVEYEKMKAIDSVLPELPNEEGIDDLILDIRLLAEVEETLTSLGL